MEDALLVSLRFVGITLVAVYWWWNTTLSSLVCWVDYYRSSFDVTLRTFLCGNLFENLLLPSGKKVLLFTMNHESMDLVWKRSYSWWTFSRDGFCFHVCSHSWIAIILDWIFLFSLTLYLEQLDSTNREGHESLKESLFLFCAAAF